MLDPVIHKMITYVQNLEEKDLKDKVLFRPVHCRSRIRTPFLKISVFVMFLSILAFGEHPRAAVSHQAAVHEVPEGAGGCGGRPAAGHVAADAQNPPLLH